MTDRFVPDKPYRFRFGDRVENISASDRNPTKYSYYIRRVHRKGFINPGKYIETTDGKGKLWLTCADSIRPAPSPTVTLETDVVDGLVAALEALTADLDKLRDDSNGPMANPYRAAITPEGKAMRDHHDEARAALHRYKGG